MRKEFCHYQCKAIYDLENRHLYNADSLEDLDESNQDNAIQCDCDFWSTETHVICPDCGLVHLQETLSLLETKWIDMGV